MKPQTQSAHAAPTSVTVIAGAEPPRARRLVFGAGLLLLGGALGVALRPGPAEPTLALLPPAVAATPPAPVPFLMPPAPASSPAPASDAPHVEIGFVIDTTGSMGGLLRAAKQKIWAIANEFADAQPRPRISIGLVAYRDHGDDYVTKFVPLTDDLDAFYAELKSLKPMGGGDAPEAVDEGLAVAMDELGFSDQQALRMLFLVGDAPAHPQKRQRCQQIVSQARQQGFRVNTIQCGDDASALRDWTQIASAGNGDFLQIDQHAKVVRVNTPFDAQIVAIQGQIEDTALFYGTRAQKKQSWFQLGSNRSLGSEESASRASCLSKTGGYYTQDLLNALEGDKVDLAKLEKDQLPEELKALSPAQRQAKIEVLQAQRAAAKVQLQVLVAKRDAFVRANHATGDGFDRQLVDCLKTQASDAGLTFKK